MNDVDLKILEIIGTDSPTIDGLSIGKSGVVALSGSTSEVEENTELEPSLPQIHKNNKRKPRFVHSDLFDQTRKKQIKLLDIIYKDKLNAYEKKVRLGLKPSVFTRELYAPTITDPNNNSLFKDDLEYTFTPL